MRNALPLVKVIASLLDGLKIAVYVLDTNDQAVVWNRTFLRFFPEHADRVHVGEPYADNLRRFYEGRLTDGERHAIDRYVGEGIVRNREQNQPYSFDHRGRRLLVASLPLPGIGRIRVWRASSPLKTPELSLLGDGTGGQIADFEHVADGVMVTDLDLNILWANEAFVSMYGLVDRAEAVGARFEDIYRAAWSSSAVAEGTTLDAGLSLLTEQMRFAGSPFELPLPERRWTRVMEQRSPDGRRFFVHVDISTIKRQQQSLVDAERRARESERALDRKSRLLEATLERMEQGVMMVNADLVVEVCNRRAVELLDLPAAMMAGRPRFESVLAYQLQQDEFANSSKDIQAFVQAGGILDRRQSYERQRPDGRWVEVQSVPLEGGGILRTYTDITQRKRTEERMRHVARHDGLTTLVNREGFLEHLSEAIHDTSRVRDGLAVHFIDLDRFKPINDSFGHAIGDKVLALAAARMRTVAREVDIVARMGGDEFAILQFGVVDDEAALGLARRILTAIADAMEIEGASLRVGASIGIALCHGQGWAADTLLRNADAAMYAAKGSGQDPIRIFTPHLDSETDPCSSDKT